jgi:hypothetical protein
LAFKATVRVVKGNFLLVTEFTGQRGGVRFLLQHVLKIRSGQETVELRLTILAGILDLTFSISTPFSGMPFAH